jgi:enoyl-CoA hydratase
MDFKDLEFIKDVHIAYVYINRPQAMNTFTLESWEEMYRVQDLIFEDQDIRVVVLAARGKMFSAGIDVSVLQSGTPQYAIRFIQKLQEYYNRWERMPQPIITAIHGMCIGGAIENALACDIRVAAQGASFCLPEINFGFSPDMGATQRVTRAVGPGQAKRLIMTGDFINAEEALRIGLVDFVVPDDELMEFTAKLAKKIATIHFVLTFNLKLIVGNFSCGSLIFLTSFGNTSKVILYIFLTLKTIGFPILINAFIAVPNTNTIIRNGILIILKSNGPIRI